MARLRADALLVARGLFESRAKARAAIDAGGVTADGRPVAKASELVEETADLLAEPAHPWVGRGALKLARAFELQALDEDIPVVVDVGSSTGGFVEVCLVQGARKVYAVDVGRGQLHPKLRADPRVVSLEGVDARSLDHTLIPEPVDLVVCDASFIGLAKVLPAALALARDGARLVCLVKPQFEVGPDKVGKGGLVTDQDDLAGAVDGVVAFLQAEGWSVEGQADSPIAGGAGQKEFLLWARKLHAKVGS